MAPSLHGRTWLACLSIIFLIAPFARAQTDEGLLLNPWDEKDKKVIEAHADNFIQAESRLQHFKAPLSINETEAQGRYRFDTQYPVEPSVGFDLSVVHLKDHGRNLLPQDLTDASVGFASPFALWNGWFLGGLVAGGYAGDDAFGNGRAWYAKAAFAAGKEIKKDSYLIIVLDYDGHRTFFPDVPMPSIEYRSQWSPELGYTIGVPLNSVTWTPNDRFTLEVSWLAIQHFEAQADYKLDKHWTAFATLAGRNRAYRVSDLPGSNDRLFFKEQRAELGLRWEVTKFAGLQAAVGYAFDRSFSHGFDERELHVISDVKSEPYVRLGVNVSY